MKKHGYIPNTETERQKMLDTLGIQDVKELFADIPEEVRLNRELDLPPAWSEIELNRNFAELSGKNLNLDEYASFLGAGAYQHYIPSAVDALVSRSEFYTAYTPYQPEISQGILQAIFEYQTMVCELTGMDVSNASMYDGPSAMAEAGIMACAATRRSKILISKAVHPEYRQIVKTYAYGQHIEVQEVDIENGLTDLKDLEAKMGDDIAGVLVQYPNFFGSIEDLKTISELTHKHKAIFVTAVNPIAMGILEAPGTFGADIVVAEGQSFGNSVSFGGPYLGMLATTQELVRRVPGRIVGQTKDHDGRRAFVLTLQAREQHIRREKASSNICSNQALNALAATIYLSYMGKQGLQEVARQNLQKAHYAHQKLSAVKGAKPLFTAPFFNEFAITIGGDPAAVNKKLLDSKIIGGYDLGRAYPEFAGSTLFAVTEMRTKEEIDRLAERLEALV